LKRKNFILRPKNIAQKVQDCLDVWPIQLTLLEKTQNTLNSEFLT